MEEVQKQGPEVPADPEGGRQSRWRGLRRGRGGQMRFIAREGAEGEQGGKEEQQVKEEEGREPGVEADAQVD